jgi:hypothetical protein
VTIIFLISSCLSGVIPLNGNDGQTAEKLRIVLDERLERSGSGQNERDTAGIHRILQRIRHLLEIPFRRVVHYVLHFIEVNDELAHLLDTIEGQWSPMMILVMGISLKRLHGPRRQRGRSLCRGARSWPTESQQGLRAAGSGTRILPHERAFTVRRAHSKISSFKNLGRSFG